MLQYQFIFSSSYEDQAFSKLCLFFCRPLYSISDGEEDIKTSDTLGDFKDEFLCDYGDGVYITEFVSGGPKNYVYKMNNGKIVEKIKGVNLNHENRKKLNFDVVKKFVLDNLNGIEREAITTVHNQFVKNPNVMTIYNITTIKMDIIH